MMLIESLTDMLGNIPTFLAGALPSGNATGPSITQDPAAGPGGGAPPGGGLMMFLPFLLIAAMFILLPLSGRKERKRHASMIAGLNKHDQVRTNGGIIGTVMDVKDSQITLKVDDTSNTRITFDKAAIQAVLKHAKGTTTEPAETEEAA